MMQTRTKKIWCGIVVAIMVLCAMSVVACQRPSVEFLEDRVTIDVTEEFYRIDPTGEIVGTIPVEIKGNIKLKGNIFQGTIAVEGYEIQYLDENPYNHATYDEKMGIVHFNLFGIKPVMENNIPGFAYSEYSYNMSICKENPDQIIIRVGQLNMTAGESSGWNIDYPQIFSAVRAEDEAAALEVYRKMNSQEPVNSGTSIP